MKTANVLRCAACKKRIRPHEPDLILQDLATERKRFFHTRCGSEAYALVARSRPGVYRLTVRHVEEVLN